MLVDTASTLDITQVPQPWSSVRPERQFVAKNKKTERARESDTTMDKGTSRLGIGATS